MLTTLAATPVPAQTVILEQTARLSNLAQPIPASISEPVQIQAIFQLIHALAQQVTPELIAKHSSHVLPVLVKTQASAPTLPITPAIHVAVPLSILAQIARR